MPEAFSVLHFCGGVKAKPPHTEEQSGGNGGRGSFLLKLTSAERERASEGEHHGKFVVFSDESLPGHHGSEWEGRGGTLQLVFLKGDYSV